MRTCMLLALLVAGCGSSGSTPGHACAAAGGTCKAVGNAPCQTRAPDAQQDCNPPPNILPSGPFCCLDPVDGGHD